MEHAITRGEEHRNRVPGCGEGSCPGHLNGHLSQTCAASTVPVPVWTKPAGSDGGRRGNGTAQALRGAPAVRPPSHGASSGIVGCSEHVEQIRRLRSFLSPQATRFILSCDERQLLEWQRREIIVAFCHLRGFTAFSETAAPEDVTHLLRQYCQTLGDLVTEFDGTLDRFTGDGMMVYFDQPSVERQALRAIRMSLAMRERAGQLCAQWNRLDFRLDFGMGIALGFASIGALGFEGRYYYGAIGPVIHLASRLCDQAAPGQILISQRLLSTIQESVEVDALGRVALGGFHSPMPVYTVKGLKGPGEEPKP